MTRLPTLPSELRDGQWKTDAACVTADGDWINMPEKYHGSTYRRIKAKEIAICEGCAVRVECLEYALAFREAFGIWGGKLPHERKRMRKQNNG